MNDLLEDAIRAGIERGMDEAPLVGDLAERVRTTPRPRRALPALAVAASVVAVTMAVGLAVISPWSSDGQPSASRHPSTPPTVHPTSSAPSPPTGPPYPTSGAAAPGSPMTGAVGTWVPVWFAGYDGPSPGRLSPQPRLQVKLKAARPGVAARMDLTPLTTSCQALPVVLTSTSGRVIGAKPGPSRFCTGVSTAVERAFGVAVNEPDSVSIGRGGALTIYKQGVPLAQFVKQGQSLPPQASTASLSDETLGSWTRLGLPHGVYVDSRPPTIALGGVVALTLDAAGTYSGASRCAMMSGSFTVQADSSASFGVPQVDNHRCPVGPSAVGAISDARQVARYGHFLDLLDGRGRVLGSFEEAVPNEVEGGWSARGAYANLSFDDGVIRGNACGIGYWTYTIDSSGRFTATPHYVPQKCVGPTDPGGLVTALKEAASVRLNSGGQLQLLSAEGKVLVTLTKTMPA